MAIITVRLVAKLELIIGWSASTEVISVDDATQHNGHQLMRLKSWSISLHSSAFKLLIKFGIVIIQSYISTLI